MEGLVAHPITTLTDLGLVTIVEKISRQALGYFTVNLNENIAVCLVLRNDVVETKMMYHVTLKHFVC